MPYADKQRQAEYQREWMARRRQAYFHDKSCVRCGATDNLELDHVDPAQKVSHRVWSWSEARRAEEISKCQILCRRCHAEKTSLDLRQMHKDRRLRPPGYRRPNALNLPQQKQCLSEQSKTALQDFRSDLSGRQSTHLDRASASGAEGRPFEPDRARHKIK